MAGAERMDGDESACGCGPIRPEGRNESSRIEGPVRRDRDATAARRHRRHVRCVCACRNARSNHLRRSVPATSPAVRRGRPPVTGAVRRSGNRKTALEAVARIGGMVDVDRQPHRVLSIVHGRVLAVHAASGAVYLVPDEELVLALPPIDLWYRMMSSGRIVETEIHDRIEGGKAEGIIAQCDLLDGAGVGNGCKAISIYMHANWRGDLVQRYGPASPAATLKRWRTLRARGADDSGVRP